MHEARSTISTFPLYSSTTLYTNETLAENANERADEAPAETLGRTKLAFGTIGWHLRMQFIGKSRDLIGIGD